MATPRSSHRCGACGQEVNPVSYVCPCGKLAEFKCDPCSILAWEPTGAKRLCPSCRTPMTQRGTASTPVVDMPKVLPITLRFHCTDCGFEQVGLNGEPYTCQQCGGYLDYTPPDVSLQVDAYCRSLPILSKLDYRVRPVRGLDMPTTVRVCICGHNESHHDADGDCLGSYERGTVRCGCEEFYEGEPGDLMV